MIAPVPTRPPLPDEIRALIERLAPGRWPGVDVDALAALAVRCGESAAAVDRLVTEIDDAHRRLGAGAGATHEAIIVGGARLTGPASELSALSGRLVAVGHRVHAYAVAVATAQRDMTVVAAITERELLRADLRAALGDGTSRIVAAGAGAGALTAVADDLADRAHEAGRMDVGGGDTTVSSGAAPAMAGAAFPRVSVVAGPATGRHPCVASESADRDHSWLAVRALALQSSLPPETAGYVRIAVGAGRSADGTQVIVVGTSDPYPYQREGMALERDDILVGDGRAPELAVVDHLMSQGAAVTAIAAATPSTPDVVERLTADDIEVVTVDRHDPTGPDADLVGDGHDD
ncbi:hypothetical protein AAFP35_09020 [Gordonia sp. CPCC 206044]|uniref:hypothetical protein n=1 Tax=Gordonia sp. CPCC 206044 TaxID=3140793 RepID=UPI003AF395BC